MSSTLHLFITCHVIVLANVKDQGEAVKGACERGASCPSTNVGNLFVASCPPCVVDEAVPIVGC